MSNQPQVPPRPNRGQVAAPVVPPRPANRSPLNESPFQVDSPSQLQRMASLNASRSSLDLPARPPSVTLPSIGQEGSEYEASTPMEEEAVGGLQDSPGTSPRHTRKVSNDLPLHAPRPSLSSADAKQRVAAVVRTDSSQASAATTGNKQPAALKAKPSFQRPGSSASHERPRSVYEDEHGIPSFGVQVPLGNQYGDVQAPSPAPFGSQASTPRTPGFDTSRPSTGKHHTRKHSGRNDFQAPPGSYGLHGHGVQDTSDPFEKDWLQKHPDVQREELAAHSPAIIDRHDYNLTPAELNKLVKQSRGVGFGASAHNSMPDEQIGYLVSEKYSTRGATPGSENTKPGATHAVHGDSPLKSASVTADDLERAAVLNAASTQVHVDAPEHKESKHVGRGQASEQEHKDLGPRGGNTEDEGGYYNENGYGVPILASDEIDPSGSYLQPALPPISEGRRGSQQDSYSRPGSRTSSRPGSIHNVPSLHRVISRSEQYTPLDDVREYEPLFPEDDKPGKKPMNPADRFKQRPELKQRFPSQDIWEDAPASVMMSAEVETPEEEPIKPKSAPAPAFETPEAERARKGEVTEQERAELLPKEARLAKSQFQPHLKQEMRHGVQRFPSRDIWEDTPDSAYMTTTVGDEEEEDRNLADDAGAVVATKTLSREGATAGAPAVALPDEAATSKPSVPPRPARASSPNKAAPQIPARPVRRPSPQQDKPSVPVRPSKTLSPNEGSADSPGDDAGSSRSVDAAKPKPPVPARPVGGKIAALQAGFMSDLNKKLGLGPQERAPKKEEPDAEEDKKPLEDARKGRARGPARRKPAASPSAGSTGAAPTGTKGTARSFAITPVYNLYDISPEGQLTATHADNCEEELKFKDGLEQTAKEVEAKTETPISRTVPPAAGFNTAGEPVHPPTITPEAVRATAQSDDAPASTYTSKSEDLHSGSAVESPIDASTSKATEEDEQTKGLAKQRTTSSSGTQTGEMRLVLDKDGTNPQTMTGYKNGSAHEEGYAFVKDEADE